MKYYLDTCVWMDYLEEREGGDKRFGSDAEKLLAQICSRDDIIIISRIVIAELQKYHKKEIQEIMEFFESTLKYVDIEEHQLEFATHFASRRNVQVADACHALLARKNDAILVTQDKHFEKLKDIVEVKKPRELF
ncbi:MAG: PIN domain-containing protein [Candidatus Woesearchaeota archaeon]|nr:PIN domain-containing protein [Candidatus Woesearchaeota archaeon]